jgi:hypothetical protein
MELNIRRISTTVRAIDGAVSGATTDHDATDLDRLAALVLERQQRLLDEARARSLAPDDPRGELGRWA